MREIFLVVRARADKDLSTEDAVRLVQRLLETGEATESKPDDPDLDKFKKLSKVWVVNNAK